MFNALCDYGVNILAKEIYVSQSTCEKWRGLLQKCNMIYLHAMAGYGKSAQAQEFAKNTFDQWKVFSAVQDHFLEDVRAYLDANRDTTQATLLIIDDLCRMSSKEKQGELFGLLVKIPHQKCNIKVMLLGRDVLPEYLFSLKLEQQLAVEDKRSLTLDIAQITAIMDTYPSMQRLSKSEFSARAADCMNFSHGCAVAVVIYLQRLSDNVGAYSAQLQFAQRDLEGYFELKLAGMADEMQKSLMRLGVFESFTLPMAQKLIGNIKLDDIHKLIAGCGFIEESLPGFYVFEQNFNAYICKKFTEKHAEMAKADFEIAGEIYQESAEMEPALRCYDRAKNYGKITEIVMYLSENADGCDFARISSEYIEKIPPDVEKNTPRLLGAKAMIEAYRMQGAKCEKYIKELKEMVDNPTNGKNDTEALRAYVRTVIACPIATADKLKDNLLVFSKYVVKNGLKIDFIMPTGNMPSVINGGLDLYGWSNANKLLISMIKKASETICGFEAVGIYDTVYGELYYERNKKSKAMDSLSEGLDQAKLKGSVRVEYAATAVIAKLLMSENNLDKSREILGRLHKRASEQNRKELIPNIYASEVLCALRQNDISYCMRWLEQSSPDEFDTFYITSRHRFLTKARVYIALSRDMEALNILGMLERYADTYHRKYLCIELKILRAIIAFRQNEPWKEHLITAINMANEYGIVRVFADEGAALIPLWKEMEWDELDFNSGYIRLIKKEMEKIAVYYPSYLRQNQTESRLTKKEVEVLHLISQGYRNAQIATELDINIGTVKFHISNIMKKFGVNNRTMIVKVAKEEGEI